MSDTPETQEAVERWQQGKINIFDEMARLETERNKERAVSEKRRTLLIYFMDAVGEVERERDEQTAQMCQAIGYLSTVAEDCEAWLNGESDEPSMDFIKAVRDYARKAING